MILFVPFVTFCEKEWEQKITKDTKNSKRAKGAKKSEEFGEHCLSPDSPSRVVRPWNTPDSESQATEGKEVKENKDVARNWCTLWLRKILFVPFVTFC